MSKKYVVLICLVTFIAGVNLFIRPLLYQRQAVQTLQQSLKAWQIGDLSGVYAPWKIKEKIPPINQIRAYNIIRKVFSQDKSVRKAQLFVRIELTPDEILPPDKIWVFELEHRSNRWQITDFYPPEPGVQ